MLEAIQNLDGAILLGIQSMRLDFLNPIVEAFTHLGDKGILWIVLSLLLILYPKTRKAGAMSLLALFLGMIGTNVILKHLFARPRPWLDVAGLVNLVNEPDPNSFPSGHTTAAFAAGLVWLKSLPWKWGRAGAVVLAVCMGLSRLYVGVHYPSDVLVGVLVGSLAAWGALTIARIWNEKRSAKLHS